jgi:tetratricopeptide (TPR) repeat protein
MVARLSARRQLARLAWCAGAALLLSNAGAAEPAAEGSPAPTEILQAAEARYRSGRELLAGGDWERACAEFDASLKILARPTTLLHIADCRARAGALVQSLADYEKALAMIASEPFSAERRDELARVAREGIARVRPRVPTLAIVVERAPPDLRIELDGAVVGTEALAEAMLLDPGRHVIVARATGHETWRRELALEEGKEVVVELALDRALPKPTRPAPPPPGPTETERSADVPPWIWVSGGAGLLLVGAAVAFRIDGAIADARIIANCGEAGVCSPARGYDPAGDEARAERDLGLFIGLGAAGVVAIGAAVVGLVAHAGAPSATAPEPRLAARLEGVGVRF